VEEIYGAFLAAAEGARASGRPVYLLDPDPAGLPSEPGSAFVALFTWSPDAEARLFRALAGTRRIPSGLLLPVVPGWTDEDRFLDSLLSRVRDLGAGFAAPFRLCGDGETRRALVEARGEVAPAEVDRFFERVHHGDAQSERESQRRIRAAVERLGLEAIPTRPVGLGEARGNAGAAARLEEMAQASDENEHRAALLRAAARWIDESGRDLGAVLREGNFAKVFPFGEQVRREAEAAFVSPERAEAPR
jgi:hypothetical protein